MSPDHTILKYCSACGQWKPADREHFHAHKRKKDGLSSTCIECAKERARAWYAENTERTLANVRVWGENNRERVAENKKRYHEAHRDKLIERTRQRYQSNKAEHLAKCKEWREANKERKAKTNKAWYEANKIRILERSAITGRAWRQANPGKLIVNSQRRRTAKRGLPVLFTADDRQYAIDYFGGCCAVCGRQPGLWHALAMDHWIPLSSSDCPGTVAWNMVPLCHGVGGCNNSKFNNDAAEWLIEKFGKRKGRAILKRIEAYLDSRR